MHSFRSRPPRWSSSLFSRLLRGSDRSPRFPRLSGQSQFPPFWNNRAHRKKNPLYVTWCEMKRRCYDSNYWPYEYYGAKGIKVCDRWLESFDNFANDMGERPSGRTLDRINNNGDYQPDNCRWATRAQQQQNRRACKLTMPMAREMRKLAAQGARQVELARRFDVSHADVWHVVNSHTWKEG